MTNTPPATIHLGDCIEVMRTLPENSVDAIVTDPPYGLGFMGKAWDELPPGEEWARECLRVLKPGGHLLAFGGSRTWHRLAVAVEDAGFEVRDSIAWLYGSGFPKSLDVSKAIDKMRTEDLGPVKAVRSWLNEHRLRAGLTLGDVNERLGMATNGGGNASNWMTHPTNINLPRWEQWALLKALLSLPDDMDAEVWRLNGRKGTPGDAWDQREVVGKSAHKSGIANGTAGHHTVGGTIAEHYDITAPATDDARKWAGFGTALKPAFEPIVVARKPIIGTVAANVLAHGTGALNIDGCRVGMSDADFRATVRNGDYGPTSPGSVGFGNTAMRAPVNPSGRWPANVVLDESQAEALDQMSGLQKCGGNTRSLRASGQHGGYAGSAPNLKEGTDSERGYGDSGGASRFFPTFKYQAKAPTSERIKVDGVAHPTVKPLALMRWLVRLVTPPGGTVLEPFAGSGTTVEACALEGFACIAIEREPDYLPLIQARLARVEAAQPEPAGPSLFEMEETA